MSDKAPDLIEPFLGWKGLLADEKGGLWSPTVEAFWPVGKPLKAKCVNKGHVPPMKGCMCGIYAVKTFEQLRKEGYNWSQQKNGKVWIVAQIALYGNVRKGRIGWRASKAAIQKVYVPAHKLPLGAKIRDRYGVDLGVIDRFTGRRI